MSRAGDAGAAGVGWQEAETTTHQDHVVAHVIGATVSGYFAAEEALYLLLDIGFYWVVYLDAGMTLLLESLALRELQLTEEERARLAEEADALRQGDASSLSSMRAAPAGCRVESVEFYESGARCRLLVRGESASLEVVADAVTREFTVREL
ncbi:MAG: hypothetical protein LC785_18530 [Acidobacteria bacterium]|nr:hypothetical protein [Acidobacteriota bacterium]